MKLTKNTSIALLSALLVVGATEVRAQTDTKPKTDTAAPATPAPGAGGRQRGAGGPGGRGGANAITNILAKLDLTAEQNAKLKPILEERTKKMAELRTPGTPPDADSRAKMMALQTEYMGKIEAVLTTEQKDKLKKLQEEAAAARAAGGAGGGRRGGANGGAPATPAPGK
ncbi:MAG: hypothetical protein JWN25_1166 [Verrucomicrobiales bacterium]|nr:hypothetical protein [Verrucomicrobiales bacterium]